MIRGETDRLAWQEINRRIKECLDSSDPVCCLQNLLEKENDGMVALALGEQYECRSMLAEALRSFEKAESLFPHEEWKEKARQAKERVEQRLTQEPREEEQWEELLFVVSCTKKKIWHENPEADEYVPAREAYLGDDFLDWIKDPLSEKARWAILSAKYGFIEPDHPIANYDATFNDPETGPISDQTLINQVKYQCRWKDRRKLNSFRQIVVHGSPTYLQKVKITFCPTRASVISWDEYKVGLSRVNQGISKLRENLVPLLRASLLNIKDLQRKDLPTSPGVYVIYADSADRPLYIGKSDNLARRIWDNHIKGNMEASILRKKIGQKEKTADESLITSYIVNRCQLRFLSVDESILSSLEHFAIGVLQPLLNE